MEHTQKKRNTMFHKAVCAGLRICTGNRDSKLAQGTSHFYCQNDFGYSGSFVLPNKLSNILFEFCEKCPW